MSKKHGKHHYHNSYGNNSKNNHTGVKENKIVELKDNINSNCKLVAIDTNVFIDLSHMRHGEDYKYRKGKEARFFENMYNLKRMAETGQVKFVILPTVFKELSVHGMSENEKAFFNKNCVLYEPVNKIEFSRQVAEITRKYIEQGVMKRSKTPFGDAIIMAESAVSGINILTNNLKDFILYDPDMYTEDKLGDIVPSQRYFEYDEEQIPSDISKFNEEGVFAFLAYKQRTRAIDIAKVNETFNLIYPTKTGFKVIPMPFSVMDYMGKKGAKSGLKSTKQFDTETDLSKVFLAGYEFGNDS